MFVPQKTRQWSGQAQGVAPFDRVDHGDLLLMDQVVVKAPDAVQMAVDGLGTQPSIQQMINVAQQDLMRYLLDGDIDPQNELTQRIHVVSDGVGGVVAPLKKAPVMNNRVGNGHGFPRFR